MKIKIKNRNFWNKSPGPLRCVSDSCSVVAIDLFEIRHHRCLCNLLKKIGTIFFKMIIPLDRHWQTQMEGHRRQPNDMTTLWIQSCSEWNSMEFQILKVFEWQIAVFYLSSYLPPWAWTDRFVQHTLHVRDVTSIRGYRVFSNLLLKILACHRI